LRDVPRQGRGLLRDLADLVEAVAGLDGDLVARLHFLRALFHRHDRLLGLGLDRLDEHHDVLGGLAGALGELAHFLGHDREAPAVCSMASIISLALARTCCAASRTSSMIVASSPTITLMASTTLPRTSEVTSPRRVRSPCEISVATSRNRVMLRCRSSCLRRSSSRSASVCTSERRRTIDSLNVIASCPISSREWTGTSFDRSPWPTRSATWTSC